MTEDRGQRTEDRKSKRKARFWSAVLLVAFFVISGGLLADTRAQATQTDISKVALGDTSTLDRGWSVFEKSVDTKTIYVSNSEGNDASDGLSEQTPVKTIAKGKALIYEDINGARPTRNGTPDWLLLKRGDVWTNESFGTWMKSGRSATEPMIISSYGTTSERPLVKTGKLPGIFANSSASNFAIIGIDLYAHTRDPNSAEFVSTVGDQGIYFLGNNQNVLIEDCRIRYYIDNLIVQGVFDNVAIRRNEAAFSYSTESHSQGIYTYGKGHLLLEDNLFHANGWNHDMSHYDTYSLLGTTNPADWRTITNGRFRVRVDGTYYDVDSLNFSAATQMSDVAKIMQDAVNAKIGNANAVTFTAWKTLILFSSNKTGGDIWNISQYLGTQPGTDIQTTPWLNGTDSCDLTHEADLPAHDFHTAPRTDIAKWQQVTSGSFRSAIDGVSMYADKLDFSKVNTMDDVALILKNAMNVKLARDAVEVWWSAPLMYFKSTAATGGKVSPLNASYYGGTDITTGQRLNSYNYGRVNPWYPNSTIFNRNMYLAGGYGNTIVRGNIDSWGASGGMQLRMGGITEDNLYLRNPHAIVYGHGENPPNTIVSGVIRNNVILGASNIDTQVQGSGILIGSAANVSTKDGSSLVENLSVYGNIIAHNVLGSTNYKTLTIYGDGTFTNLDIHDNISYDWTNPAWTQNTTDHRSYMLLLGAINPLSSNVVIHDNIFQQTTSGFVAAATLPVPAGVRLYRNSYYTPEPDPPSLWSRGWFQINSAVSSSEWIGQTGETEISMKPINFPAPERDINTYMVSIGMTPTYEAFIEKAMDQNKLSWDERFTSYAVNQYVRGGFATVSYGDVSGDNQVNGYDAALVAQASVNLILFTADQTKAADVSGDNEVTAFDAALIAQKAVGSISKFPVERG